MNSCLAAAIRYIKELDWWLAAVHAIGAKSKAPLYSGWPDLRPDTGQLTAMFKFDADAAIRVNLGGTAVKTHRINFKNLRELLFY
jgi:hypothetical protein